MGKDVTGSELRKCPGEGSTNGSATLQVFDKKWEEGVATPTRAVELTRYCTIVLYPAEG